MVATAYTRDLRRARPMHKWDQVVAASVKLQVHHPVIASSRDLYVGHRPDEFIPLPATFQSAWQTSYLGENVISSLPN